jgi:transcriptional regulator with XRE-family HTH domain
LSLFPNLKLYGSRVKHLPKNYPKALKTFGDHVLKARLDKQLSQEAAAKIIGVNSGTIRQWENDNVPPKIYNYPVLIKFIGYDPNYQDDDSLVSRVENFRRAHGLNLKDFSRKANMSNTVIYELLRGIEPSPNAKKKIEDLLNRGIIL